MTNDELICSAFAAGRKAEREAIADWLYSKAYLTLASLVKAGAHEVDQPIGENPPLPPHVERQIRAMTEAERKRAAERGQANGGRA